MTQGTENTKLAYYVKPAKWLFTMAAALGFIMATEASQAQTTADAKYDATWEQDVNVEFINTPETLALDSSKLNEPEGVIVNIEQLSTFPGGLRKFRNTIKTNAKAAGTAIGKLALVSFLIDIDGKLIQPEIKRGVDVQTDKLLLESLKRSPKWSPGIRYGRPLRVRYTMYIQL